MLDFLPEIVGIRRCAVKIKAIEKEDLLPL